jgi:hypothetical protein
MVKYFEKSEEMNLEKYTEQIIERVKHSEIFNPNIESKYQRRD